MQATRVVNMRRGEAYDVYIGRGPGGRVAMRPGERGYYGSPFVMNSESERARVVEEYRKYFARRIESDPVFRAEVAELRGRTLGCWCAPRACHGDALVEWLEGGRA